MDERDVSDAVLFQHEQIELSRRKDVRLLCKTDLMVVISQTIGEGGETNLHSHQHLDGIWFVLRGRARFYTTSDEVVGEIGPFEGVLIPRGYPYWFERVGDENLELLQIEASDRRIENLEMIKQDRVDYTPPKSAVHGFTS